MSPVVALEPKLSSAVDLPKESSLFMDDIFERLLQADKNSPEFAELWAEVDAYLTAAVEEERSAS